jgi:hypothetical protein
MPSTPMVFHFRLEGAVVGAQNSQRLPNLRWAF